VRIWGRHCWLFLKCQSRRLTFKRWRRVSGLESEEGFVDVRNIDSVEIREGSGKVVERFDCVVYTKE
jgi:hypothetical protein